jgi:hypothetical protein
MLTVDALTQKATKGMHRLHLPWHHLAPGGYRLTVTPQAGTSRTITFTISR